MNREPPPTDAVPSPEDEPASSAGLVRSVLLGLRDTWESMLAEGRRSARATHDRRWRDFDARTKSRRGFRH